MKIKYYLLLFLFLFSFKGKAQNDCVDAIVVCGTSGFSGLTATGIGIQEIPISCQSNENNSIWLRLNINTSGTLGFTLIPSSNDIAIDFDFFIFGPNVTCGSLGNTIRCSTTNPRMANLPNNHTGMNDTETDTSEGAGALGNSFLQQLDVIAGESYFLVIDRPNGNSDFSIQWTGTATFNEPPTFQIPAGNAIDITKCDTDSIINGFTSFDFTQNTNTIIGTQTGVQLTYHRNQNDATTNENPILTPNDFTNTQNPQRIFARITNPVTGCFDTTDFLLTVQSFNVIPANSYSVCDNINANDGDDTNGLTTFDLDLVTSEIFGGNSGGLNISYYLNQADAFPENSRLTRFFTNTVPLRQSVFMKAKNADGCYEIKEIFLNANPLPPNNAITLVQCDFENEDGKTIFNLTQATPELTDGNPDLRVEYFENSADEQNNVNSITELSNDISHSLIIIARITNTLTQCIRVVNLTLSVNIQPGREATIFECDIMGVENGIAVFNLNESNLKDSPTSVVTFYENFTDALLEANAIPDPENYSNGTAYHDIIYARVEDANKCSGVSVVNLKVNVLPDIDPESDGNDYICTNLPENFITIDAGLLSGLTSDYTYIWRLDGNVFPRTSYSIQVNKAGAYTVEVINKINACRKIRSIVVHPSNDAEISSIAVQDVITDQNSVTINISPNSIGSYQYSLNNPDGPFQDSNFFENVKAGIHTAYVYDIHGCGTVSATVVVVGFPKFFTPNGDGINDTWKVDAVDSVFNNESKMYIFDRHGKLVKEIASRDTSGWDGTLNGNPLPSDDYWYVLYLEDGRTAKGHFALKR